MPRTFILLFFLLLFSGAKALAQTDEVEDTSALGRTEYFDSFSRFSKENVHVRQVPDTTWKELKNEDAFWYADLAPERNKEKENTGHSVLLSGWFKTLIWIIIIISMVSVLIWYLASSDIRLFRKPSKTVLNEENTLFTEDIFAVDYENEIRKATADQNYRLAIRLFYLRTLKELSDHDLIQYRHESTNSDYLAQLSGTGYYKDFFRLTRDFEYAWYGKFEFSPDTFQLVRDDFSHFKFRLAS